MPRIIFCLVFTFLLPLQLFSEEMRTIDKMALNVICAQKKLDPKEYKKLNLEVCQMIVQSDLCKDYEPRMKRDCHADLKDEDDSSMVDNVFGCLEGVLTSAHDIYQLVKSFLFFIKDYTLSEDYRSKKNKNLEAKVDNLLLNYETEVLRVSSTLSGPLKESRASLMVASSFLISQIGNLLKSLRSESAEFACLNEAGVVERSCHIMANILFPPVVFFDVILKGRSALKAYITSTLNKARTIKANIKELKLKRELTKEGPVKVAFVAHKKLVIKNLKKGLEINRHESSKAKNIEDKKRVKELYEKGDEKEAAKLNYQLNMERLVEQFPPEVRANLKKLLSSDYRIIDSEDLDGAFVYSSTKPNGYMRIELPAKFHGTELEYMIKTHETHHAVMYYLKGPENLTKLNLKVNLVNDLDFLIKERFLDEAGAMAREWQYLDHVPKDRVEKLLAEVVNDPKSSQSLKDFSQQALVSDKSASSHVIQQHKKERYGKKEIKKQMQDLESMYSQAILEQRVWSGAKAVGFGYMTVEIYSYCTRLKESKNTTNFYQDICQKFPNFLGHFN
ncbi:MAG: hypothetical protein KBD76_03620 [Bacteriovorax sp.]|nr:hypothetical protein [Bacteriovorax sp.]